jgi:hypothetical protein
LNLTILLIAVAMCAVAWLHHQQLARSSRVAFAGQSDGGSDIGKVKSDLANMDLTEDALKNQVNARLKLLGSLRSDTFYLSIDTAHGVARLQYGTDDLREMPVQVGPPQTIAVGGKRFTFAPLKGSFGVVDKAEGLSWVVPEWVYAMNHQPPPAARPAVPNGLGKYVIVLPSNYVIHSPPAPDSPLKGPKPGSFMMQEEDLRAIWPRISKGTLVYVF